MENFLEKKINRIISNVTSTLDETLMETKLFYKFSINPHTVNIVSDKKSIVLSAVNEQKQLHFNLRSILSEEDYGPIYFLLKNSINSETYTDFFTINKGINVINRLYELTPSVWNINEDSLTIDWDTFLINDTTKVMNGLVISAQLQECGI